MSRYSLSHLSDPVLLRDLAVLVAGERATTAELLAHLAEVDARRLYLPAAYPSMYAWCVGELKLSEDAAAKRIQAARVARRFPAIFPMLADGRLHLSGVVLLAPHLLSDNADDLLAAAAHLGKSAIERLLAERFPRPDVPSLVQALLSGDAGGEQAPGHVEELGSESTLGPADEAGLRLVASSVHGNVSQHAPGRVESRARLTPLSPGRVALQVTLAQETHDKLRYAQSLLGHAVPSGDLAQVLDRALAALIAQLEKRRFSRTARTRPNRRGHSQNVRHIPAAVRSLVWQRDGGQCTFVSESGHRCESRTRLEFDHIEAFARGGESTPSGLRLRCRAHNQYTAECVFGTDFMHHKREQARRQAAEGREAKRARQALDQQHEAARGFERERVGVLRARQQEVIPWLRALGFRADEALRAAEQCGHMADAPLEARVRAALSHLAPHGARKVACTMNAQD